jgi:uncharacterized membrane protein
MTKATLKTEALPVAIWLAMAVMTALSWHRAPERLPVHYDVWGHADGWGSRAEGLLIFPVMALVIYVLPLILPRLDPGRANYASFAGARRWLRVATMFFSVALQTMRLLPLYGVSVSIGRVTPVLIGLLFLVIGAVMGKLRPNWFFGVRTPWTLSSKRSWVRTHRLAGWLFVAAGVLTLLAALVAPAAGAIVGVGTALIAAVVSIVYSYLEWRRDPDRVGPAGTHPAAEHEG